VTKDDAHEPIPAETEALAAQLVEAAFRAHRALGPGLLESVYEACVCHELAKMGVPLQRQVNLPVEYDGVRLATGFRVDLLVGRRIIVELKAVEELTNLHLAQLMTYLRLSDVRLGFLINFNVVRLKDGITRRVLWTVPRSSALCS